LLTGLPAMRAFSQSGHDAGRHAADQLLEQDLVAVAEQGAQGRDDGRVLLDEGQVVLEPLQQVAAGRGVDPDILRVGVELGFRQEQVRIEGPQARILASRALAAAGSTPPPNT
jgi:hypothetical protein